MAPVETLGLFYALVGRIGCMDQNPHESPQEPQSPPAKRTLRWPSLYILSLNFTTACFLVSIVASSIEAEQGSVASHLAYVVNWSSLCGAAIGLLVATASSFSWQSSGP
jgi:hypothetical protein